MEDPIDIEQEKTVNEASDRMKTEIEARFAMDEENLSDVMVQNITYQMFINISFIVILAANRSSYTFGAFT